MKMAERMARAILQSRFYDCEPEMYPGGLEEFFSSMDEDNWAEARFEAYAALRAMREPSEAMKAAFDRDFDAWYSEKIEDPHHLWKSMIEAALSET